LDKLATSVEGSAKRIDTVNVQEQFRFLFLKLYSNNRDIQRTGTLDQESQALFSQGFEGVRDIVKEVGRQTGREIDTSRINASGETLTLRPGMTVDEVKTEVTAYFSKELNLALRNESAFGNAFDKYVRSNEEYAETIVRVVTANDSINASMKNLGTVNQRFAALNYDASEAIVEAFGSTQAAISAFEAYGSSMFTEQEQLDRKRQQLAERLNKLGLQDIRTKAQYTAKIQQ
jgi:hypothetical protein